MVTDLTVKLRIEKGASLTRQLAILEQYTGVESRVPSARTINNAVELVRVLVRVQAEWTDNFLSLLDELEGFDREEARLVLSGAAVFGRDWQTLADSIKVTYLDQLDGHPKGDQFSADVDRAAATMADVIRKAEEALMRLRASWEPKAPDRLAAGLAEARAGQGLTGDEMIAAIRARRP